MPVNPVLRRELVERWRSRRAILTLTVYLGVLAGLQYLLYRAGLSVLNQQFGFFGGVDATTAGPMLGRFLLEGLLFFVLLLVLFVAPGYAAATLSGERERRTLPLLQTTLLHPLQIVIGKLGASTAWLVLLVAAALPLGAASFFLGGVAVGDLLRGIGYVVVIGVCIAAIGIGVSSVARRTTGAVVVTYGIVLALTAGTLFVSAVEFFIRSNAGRVDTPVVLHLNPFYGLADAVRAERASASMFGGGLPSPLAIIAESLPGGPLGGGVVVEDRFGGEVFIEEGFPVEEDFLVEDDVFLEGDVDIDIADEPMPMPVPMPMPEPGPMPRLNPEPFGPEDERQGVWLKVMGLYALLGIAGIAVASRRVRTGQTAARIRNGRREGARGGTSPRAGAPLATPPADVGPPAREDGGPPA